MTGAVTGLAKGLIGTIAKPAAGLLDFASGTTLAITQSTRSSESIGELEICYIFIFSTFEKKNMQTFILLLLSQRWQARPVFSSSKNLPAL